LKGKKKRREFFSYGGRKGEEFRKLFTKKKRKRKIIKRT